MYRSGFVRGVRLLVAVAAGFLSQNTVSVNAQLLTATYASAQAEAGKAPYAEQCASCHGANLDDGPFAPPLRAAEFRQRWSGKPVDALFDTIRNRMPPSAPGSLSDDTSASILALILQENGVTSGTQRLPADSSALARMVFLPALEPVGGRLSAGVTLPPPPPKANPLDRITPVTEAMLRNPPEGEWLTWRRTTDAQGFSPLKTINKGNVGRLRTAWAWTLPNGPNESTPLFHDGVLFVQSYGDKVQALDAATGDLLWQYSRKLPKGTSPAAKKAMALLGHRLYVPTSDAHIVALDVKSGRVVWDSPATADGSPAGMSGGPLVAKGKVIVGMRGGAGGGAIVAFDAETGKQAWRFATVARPGEPGGDSWNDLPVEKRSGGNVWTPGSYDSTLNLVFFGPSPTYDTGPLRNRVPGSASTNDALFTNATVALNPDTGKLVWYFQHMPNDQWDLDWAFERQIVRLPVNGVMKSVVFTAGKLAFFDAVEADTGKYLFSIDSGVQNLITAVDPRTGAKTVDARKIPGDGETKMICTHAMGGKNWTPSSYNPESKILFVPLNETCMEWTPVGPGETSLLSTGVRLTLRPPPDSDGKYGRLQAINLETRKTVWMDRQRAPRTTGTLATAGGVVFAGSVDRTFAAYDAGTGKVLWSTRLNDVPNSNAITYSIKGKQYVAIAVGNGAPQPSLVMTLVPEITNPPDRSSTLWVFELPDASGAP